MTAEVIQLMPATDVPAMLRHLAGRIERGEVPAQEVLCIVRTGIHRVSLYGWGDYRGNIATIGMLEAAKKHVDIEDD